MVAVLGTLVSACRKLPNLEVIVVDDGSSDGTTDLIANFAEPKDSVDLVVISRASNRGKGASIRDGIAAATGEWVVVHDADLEYDPADIPFLLETAITWQADVIYGSRFLDNRNTTTWWHWFANQVLTVYSNQFTGFGLTDVHTGMKMFRRRLLEGLDLRENRFGFCAEVTVRVGRLGVRHVRVGEGFTDVKEASKERLSLNLLGSSDLRLVEVPIRYSPRSYREGKKIRFRDGLRALWCAVRYSCFTPRDRLRSIHDPGWCNNIMR